MSDAMEFDARGFAARRIVEARRNRPCTSHRAFEVLQPACYGQAYLCAAALTRGDLHLAQQYAEVFDLLADRMLRTREMR